MKPNKSNKSKQKAQLSQDLVYGFHAVMSLLQNVGKIKTVYLSQQRIDKRMQELIDLAQKSGVEIQHCEKIKLDKMTENAAHQGVAAQLRTLNLLAQHDLAEFLAQTESPFILVLDQIQDPHNLGACLRTAECAGVDAVVLPKHGACPINATVRKVAVGAADRLTIFEVTNLSRGLQTLQEANVWITATSDKANNNYNEIDYKGAIAIVMGSEGDGVRHLTSQQCDHLVRIPMQGETSSLNVSVATGIMLFEAVRQRRVG